MSKVCRFCGKPAPDNMQGYCQVCYKYFITEGKDIYPIPKDGTVEYTENGDCICHECGKAFRKLGQHVYYAHNLTSAEYAKKHGLKLRGPSAVRLSNPDYSAHMHDVQDPETISINLIEKGSNTRFNAIKGNIKQLPTHSMKSRCANCVCLVEDDDGDWYCDEACDKCKFVMQCPEHINDQWKEEN